MSDGKKYYCFCGSNCKYETMTKEQILAAIEQATGVAVVNPDAAFITQVREQNGGRSVTFWVGTQAQYNAIESVDNNCMYIITDDTSAADLQKTVEQMAADSKASAESAQAAAEAAAMPPTSTLAAKVNGWCADVLDVDMTTPFAEKNRPMSVSPNFTTANVPDGLIYGVREVYYVSKFNVIVKIVGVTTDMQPAVWLNYGMSNDWSGWTKL